MKRLAALLVFLGLLSGQAHATCSAGSLPFNLTNGTTADASQVMSNYNAIIASVNATCAGSGPNSDITSLLGLTTALTPGQGGTNTWVATVASGGSANAQTVTTSLPSTSFTLTKGYSVTFLPGFTNTSTLTLAVNGTTATSVCVRQVLGATCSTALIGGEINTGVWTTVTYDGTNYELVSNQLQPAWGMTFTNTGAGNLVSQSVTTPARSCEEPVFANLQATVSGNNLTVTLLNQNGVTPTAAAPVLICFPSFNAGTGVAGQTWVPVTAATTFVANSGSSFGSTNNQTMRFWIVAFNNAGTVNIGVIQPSNFAISLGSGATHRLQAINETTNAVSTTACNACNNATANQTYYATTALTNVTARIIGYFEATEVTAGTWATAPSIVQVFSTGMKKPGDAVGMATTSAAANVSIGYAMLSAADSISFTGACEGSSTSANAAIGVVLKQAGTTVTTQWTVNQATANTLTTAPSVTGTYMPESAVIQSYSTTAANMSTVSFCSINIIEYQGALEEKYLPANDNYPRVARLTG